MKKRILIVLSAIIFLFIVAIFFLRHEVIGHVFEVSISKKSNKTISLDIGHVYYSILNSSITIDHSKLLFNNTFINDKKTIELSELKFDKIELDGMSLLDLIFEREFIAKKLIIANPSLWFSENDNPRPFKEKPEEIVRSLKDNTSLFGDLTIIVDEFEIINGVVDIKQLIKSEEHNGSVRFRLLLKHFNTSKEKLANEDRFLFAENHFVKLSDFIYHLPNGDIISFDSTVFETDLNNLITSNLNIELHSKLNHSHYNPVITNIREVLIEGIDFSALENLHRLVVDSIAISDVHIDITEINPSDSIITDTSNHKLDLFKVLQSYNLGSFSLNNVNLLNHNIGGDTIMRLDNLCFSVNDIKVDSTTFALKKPGIDYRSIKLSSGNISFLEKKSGLNIGLNNLSYEEKDGVASVAGLSVNEKGAISAKAKFLADADSIYMSGISLEEYISGKSLKLSLMVISPSVDVNLSSGNEKKGSKKDFDFNKFELKNLQISNGTVHLYETNKLDIVVNELDFNAGQLQLQNINDIYKTNTDGFIIGTSEVKVYLPEKDILLLSSSVSVINNDLSINNFSTRIKSNSIVNSDITFKQLQLGKFDILKVIENKEVNLKYINILHPKISGDINLNKNNVNTSNSKHSILSDYTFNIEDFRILKGMVDVDLNLKQDTVKLVSGIDIMVDNIYFDDISDANLLKSLIWKVKLKQTAIDYKGYLFTCENINSDKGKGFLSVEDLEIFDNISNTARNDFDIRKLTIDRIDLLGMDYNTLLENEKPVVKTISIENPYLDLHIDSRKNKTLSNNSESVKSIPFIYDFFEINNMAFDIDRQDTVSVSSISLKKLNFKYGNTPDDNIIEGVEYFTALGFLYIDTTKNSYLDIKEFNFNKQTQLMSVVNIAGGNINNHPNGKNHLKYVSTGVDLTGISITGAASRNISISEIDISDLVLDMENHSSKKSASNSVEIKSLNLPLSIANINIGSFKAKDIDVAHVTVSDTAVKKVKLNKLGIIIDSIEIDTNTFYDNNYAFAKDISIYLKENRFVFSDSLYEAGLNRLSYNFSKNQLSIDSLLMKPRYEPSEFFKRAVYQTGRMDIVTERIICSDFRLEELIRKGNIHIGGVDVLGLDMHIFKNKRYEINPETFKKMPQELVFSITKKVTIDSVKTHNSYLNYQQLNKKSLVPGEIFLTDFNLTLLNINNDLDLVDERSCMIAKLDAMLLDTARLDVKATFPLLSPSYDFWFTGHLDKIDFKNLNLMTQNLVGISLAQGTGELDIPLISGNSHHAEGVIVFKYKKLKIDLYDINKAKNATGLGKSMANLLLNDIFIKSNNPGFLGKTKEGEVYFKRNTQKFVVSYMWKSIMSGLMSTMGYNNKEQRQEKRALQRMWK